MYSSIIEIKKSVSGESLEKLRQTAEKAFDNRAGRVRNSSKDSHRLVFKGGEDKYGCLDLGVAEWADTDNFRKQIAAWNWIDDEEPEENCDILEIYMEPVYWYGGY